MSAIIQIVENEDLINTKFLIHGMHYLANFEISRETKNICLSHAICQSRVQMECSVKKTWTEQENYK